MGMKPSAATLRQRYFPAPPLRHGNQITLLPMGSAYFPAVMQAIENAHRLICLETYILAMDGVGYALRAALIRARQRGVAVQWILDGFGSSETLVAWADVLKGADVMPRVFRPEHWLKTLSPTRIRRLHRKMVVVDDAVAFVGGINWMDDHNFGGEHRFDFIDPAQTPGPRFDFAVQITGPLVQDVRTAHEALWRLLARTGDSPDRRSRLRYPLWNPVPDGQRTPSKGPMHAQLVLRDNIAYRRGIEKAYLQAIGHARHSVYIANAYFLPGVRFRQALKSAAQRGVKVVLLLQGRVEYRMQHLATQALYDELLREGIQIFEYTESFLHAKVATVDAHWSTVGSSNIDPFSLLLAREANVIVQDESFTHTLRRALEQACTSGARPVTLSHMKARAWPVRWVQNMAYVLLRLAVVLSGRLGRY